MGSNLRGVGALSLALALLACRAAEPATEVLVHVDSDLMVGTELKALHVQVFDRTGKQVSEERTIDLGPDAGTPLVGKRATALFRLPVRFSVYPRKGATDFRIVVIGGPLDGDGKVVRTVERQAITSFLPRQQTYLPIFLQRACLQRLCNDPGTGQRGDQTCEFGRCIDVPVVPPQPEDKFDAGPEAPAADASSDAEPLSDGAPTPGDGATGDADAGHDAGTDAGVDAASDAARDAEVDAARDAEVDAARDADTDAGPVEAGPVDAGPCGTWVSSSKDQTPPADAVSYGIEYTPEASDPFHQYVCRARASNGAAGVIPGKGVYGYSCYFTRLDNTTQDSSDFAFEVLSGTAGCARMTPVETVRQSGLPPVVTGTDALGGPLYSCAATETSLVEGAPLSHPLGRYDSVNNLCIYEWRSTTRSSTGSFDVLTRY